MAKNIEPCNGMRFIDAVEEIMKEAETMDFYNRVKGIIQGVGGITTQVNADTCLSVAQACHIKEAIFSLANGWDHPDDINKLYPYMEPVLVCKSPDDREARYARIAALILYINSCRLACRNCINKDCGARDRSEVMPTTPSTREEGLTETK